MRMDTAHLSLPSPDHRTAAASSLRLQLLLFFHLSTHCFIFYSPYPLFFSLSHLFAPSFAPSFTHSSESRSFSSLFLSLKQPRECMLSSTSGSMSSADGRLRMVTFLGTGCSGSGSFFPPLGTQRNHITHKDAVSHFGPWYFIK